MIFHLIGLLCMAYCAAFTWYNARRAGDAEARKRALIVAWQNIAYGFGLNWILNWFIIPAMAHGGSMSGLDNFCGGWIYTAASLTRVYAIHRAEVARMAREAQRFEFIRACDVGGLRQRALARDASALGNNAECSNACVFSTQLPLDEHALGCPNA